MITDEELAELPADRELAFVRIESVLRSSLDHREDQARNDTNVDPDRLEYMTRVLAAARACKIDALSDVKIPRITQQGLYEECLQFKADVDFVTMQIRVQAAQLSREGSVCLDSNTKRKIQHFIQQIRDEIERCDLDIDKKDDLLSKLNKFAAEVDRTRTKLQAGMVFFVTLCAGIGDGFEKLKPVRDMFNSVSRLLGQAMQLEDRFAPRLPSRQDRKRLEPPPQKQLLRNAEPIDDDIPF